MTQYIPSALKKYPQFVAYKPDKAPRMIQEIPATPGEYHANGSPASPSDPKTWVPYKIARKLIDDAGIGFVFTSEDPFVFIDLDDCINEKDEIAKWAKRIVGNTKCYVERSMSGRGLHIIVTGQKNGELCKGSVRSKRSGKVIGKVEVYDSLRYCALTGNACAGFEDVEPGQDIIDRAEALIQRSATAKSAKNGDKKQKANGVDQNRSPELADNEVINLLTKSTTGKVFLALHKDATPPEDLQDKSASGLVLSWFTRVYFYTQNWEQITRLFKASALHYGKYASGKWERDIRPRFDKLQADPDREVWLPKDQRQDWMKYIEVAEEQFGKDIRRDLFSGELHVRHENEWKNCFDVHIVNHMASAVAEKGRGWLRCEIEPAFSRYQHTLRKRLLLDIPKWDGIDRISAHVRCLHFEDDRLDHDICEYFVKRWFHCMWHRIKNTTVQNVCLLFGGGQGIGKDYWIDALVGGFGKYVGHLAISSKMKETDYAEAIVQKIIMVVSEFDKFHQMEVSTSKDLLSTASFTCRLPYARRSRDYPNRCSFIAAANPKSVFRDPTGNRRYALFRLSSIDWSYERSESSQLQIMAQSYALAHEPIPVNPDYDQVMRDIICQATPEDENETIIQAFEDQFQEYAIQAMGLQSKVEYMELEYGELQLLLPGKFIWEFARRIATQANYRGGSQQVIRALKEAGCSWSQGRNMATYYGPRSVIENAPKVLKANRALHCH